MRPYSMDLRERVAAAVDDHVWSLRQIAGLFRVSISFVSRLLKRRRATGALDSEPHRGGRRRVLDAAARCRPLRLHPAGRSAAGIGSAAGGGRHGTCRPAIRGLYVGAAPPRPAARKATSEHLAA
jgi:hypothetical protein